MKPVVDWEKRYQDNETGWDIGSVSRPLQEYFDQLKDKDLRILIPGCGNAHEAAYLHEKGFSKVFLVDLASTPLNKFAEKYPEFPKDHLIQANFFEHKGEYDLIVEQTFFCAINPADRAAYANHAASLIGKGGKLVGLLWATPMNENKPPFGGSKEEYLQYFEPYFKLKTFELAHNSIKPRAKRELFLIGEKK
ncbi:MAG: SAM-dependent methyltransferase [Flavobacteriales bacterium]|nr:SAM-dependent methyltransferase [Flavobacteriales bacterium]|tara:strand:- start:18481 stop:19059 length:579 start_codon:yes stop_codon:yes gene_type:complete